MIAALILAAAQAPATPPAAPLSIEEVRRDPRRWDGKWVEIEGWINRCRSMECLLAERQSATSAGEGMSLSFEAQRSFDEWAKPLLPLRVKVIARIDATCLVDLCLDRAPVLREMIVHPLQWNVPFPDEVK